MAALPQEIVEYAQVLPEATPICATTLLQFGNRAAIDQALSRLAKTGTLMRICHGVYLLPRKTRFGEYVPNIEETLEYLSVLWGDTIVPCGGSAANCLGLTQQNPVRSVYLTSGRSRKLQFGNLTVELRHTPRWQLIEPYGKTGTLIRALAWLGPDEAADGLDAVIPALTKREVDQLSLARAVMPNWMAETVTKRLYPH